MTISRTLLVLAASVLLAASAAASGLVTPSTAAMTVAEPTPQPFTTSTQLAKSYSFSGDPACQACETCRSLAAQAGMSLSGLFTFCSNTMEPFWLCLANQGVHVSLDEANSCNECINCSEPVEG